jgi:micrococcal nuclease
MGLLRILFRALRPKARRQTIAHKRLPAPDWRAPSDPARTRPNRPEDDRRLARPAPTEVHRVTVKGHCFVIDGDTIKIGDATFRLAGIDAPELDHPYGKNAKWALVNLCKGRIVHAVLDGAMSRDRTVATCYLPDGRDLSAEMVKLGLAIDWPKFSGGRYRQFEQPDIRRKLWRCDARQRGRMPPSLPD